jgi:hypothetical protein
VNAEFYQLTIILRVLKAAPVIVADIDAECIPSYDALGLAVVKSIVAQ